MVSQGISFLPFFFHITPHVHVQLSRFFRNRARQTRTGKQVTQASLSSAWRQSIKSFYLSQFNLGLRGVGIEYRANTTVTLSLPPFCSARFTRAGQAWADPSVARITSAISGSLTMSVKPSLQSKRRSPSINRKCRISIWIFLDSPPRQLVRVWRNRCVETS